MVICQIRPWVRGSHRSTTLCSALGTSGRLLMHVERIICRLRNSWSCLARLGFYPIWPSLGYLRTILSLASMPTWRTMKTSPTPVVASTAVSFSQVRRAPWIRSTAQTVWANLNARYLSTSKTSNWLPRTAKTRLKIGFKSQSSSCRTTTRMARLMILKYRNQ